MDKALGEIIEYLNRADGVFVLPHNMDTMYAPDIEFLRDGQYYGLYILPPGELLKRGKSNYKQKLSASGAVAVNVYSVEDVEKVLERKAEMYLLHKILPKKELKKLLVRWGKGDEDMDWIEGYVQKLPDVQKRIIFMHFYDRIPFDAIARELRYAEQNIFKQYRFALDALTKSIVNQKKNTGR